MEASRQHWPLAANRLVKTIAPVILLIATLLATSFAVSGLDPVSGNLAGLRRRGWLDDRRGQISDPLVYMTERSPGARSFNGLTPAKQRTPEMGRDGAKPPYERVLANVRYPSPAGDLLDDPVPAADPGLLDSPALVPALDGGGFHAANPAFQAPAVPLAASALLGGGSVDIVVPELTTWFMLVWGMVLVGFGLRTRPVPDEER